MVIDVWLYCLWTESKSNASADFWNDTSLNKQCQPKVTAVWIGIVVCSKRNGGWRRGPEKQDVFLGGSFHFEISRWSPHAPTFRY
jgi:hypothetical protein